MMKKILTYSLFEKFKMPSKEEITQKIKYEFNSLEDAKVEVDIYIDSILNLQKSGGKVYRLIWLNKKSDLNTKKLGQHWIMDIGVLDRFQSGLESGAKENRPDSKPFLIEAEIEPGQIDLSSSLGQFLAIPQENEINLKYQPKKFKIVKW
jgi:hypothetical protein